MKYELVDDRLRHALADLLGVVLAVDPHEPCVDDDCDHVAAVKQ